MNGENIINSIRNLCKENNITVTKLEEELNFSQGLISRWKDKTPSLDKIIDIANYFHTTLDEVVGYNQNINDEFLCKLYTETSNGNIKWLSYENIQKVGHNPKKFYIDYNEDGFVQENYYFCYGRGYIILYAMYNSFKMLSPERLTIFIQPSENSSMIEQEYGIKDLLRLWEELLYSLEEIPDEIKAEKLKSSFINDFLYNEIEEDNESEEDIINYALNQKGNIIINISDKKVLEQQDYKVDIVSGKEFYFKHKKILGEIKSAKILDGEFLLLITDVNIMKLCLYKSIPRTDSNMLIRYILTDAGIDVKNRKSFNNVVLYPK